MWIGNSDHSNPRTRKPATSLTAAAPLWRAFMTDYTKDSAGRDLRPAEGRHLGEDRRLVRWTAGPWTRETAKEWFIRGTQPGAKKAIDADGLLYRRQCGGWRVDPVAAELGPQAWKVDVEDWLRRARRGVGVTGRHDSRTAYFWGKRSWGGPLAGACARPKVTSRR